MNAMLAIARHECRLRSIYRDDYERPGAVPAKTNRMPERGPEYRAAIIRALSNGPLTTPCLRAASKVGGAQIKLELARMLAEGLVGRTVVAQKAFSWRFVTA